MSTTKTFDVAKPIHVVKTTELSKDLCRTTLQKKSDLFCFNSSHLPDEKICFTKDFW